MSEEINTAKDEIIENETDEPTDPASDEQALSNDNPLETIAEQKGKRRKKRILFAGGTVLLIAVIAGLRYWINARQFESTDDAFIDGDIVQISPHVPAYVKKVHVESNQFVHKGDLLVELVSDDYDIKLEQAKAELTNAQSRLDQALANAGLTRKETGAVKVQAVSNIEAARTNVEQTRLAAASKGSQVKQAEAAVKTANANLEQTRAQVAQAESDHHLAEVEYDRRSALFKKGDISRQSLDQATNQLQTARAKLNAVNKQVDAARSRVDEAKAAVVAAQDIYRQSVAQVDLTRSQVGESQGRLQAANAAPEKVSVSEAEVSVAEAEEKAAESAVHAAELELSYTKIYAPEDGYVTKKNVEEGQLVQIGTPLMAISRSNEVWVVANFKETQLEHMRVGQDVDIEVDAYPSETFHGKVESFQAGTGSRFSLLPSENATGNYVKVVQRVPVKIVFDEKPDKVHLLAPGMSVEPTVKVR
jgi:membrane fusion protein (multidrug efflux system)